MCHSMPRPALNQRTDSYTPVREVLAGTRIARKPRSHSAFKITQIGSWLMLRTCLCAMYRGCAGRLRHCDRAKQLSAAHLPDHRVRDLLIAQREKC